MNVLYVVNIFPTERTPQAGVFIQAQINSLQKQGIQASIFKINGKKDYIQSCKRLRREYDLKKYDLIHAHYSFSAIPVLFQTQCPLIVSFMGSDVNGDYNARSFYIYKWLNILFSNLVALRAAAVICKTRQMAGKLLKKAYVIPNGVDFNFFKPWDKQACRKELGMNAYDLIICFAADPEKKVKNYSLACSAVEIARRDLKKKVVLLPVYGKSRKEYIKYLNAADMLLLTSFSEGSPNVVKEALACNIPVVSVDTGDVRKQIRGSSHCHVTGYDAGELAVKIEEVLAASSRTDARDRITDLDEAAVARDIISVYKDVLRRAG